ncbi:MAG: ATP-dependent helicase [Candidatus Saccharimonadales bacterium]
MREASFELVYKSLNLGQKQAVEQTDGPVLVLAGPGTGKTQLLSARVARILQKSDTLAENILCLTFTEKGASNMRQRLASFIGQAAFNVNIATYHGFGSDLIRRYPEYFGQTRLENPVDALGQHEILADILEQMSYQNPLKSTSYHLGDLISTVSEIKRGLITASDLRSIASENNEFLNAANPQISDIFSDLVRMPGKLEKASPYFEKTLAQIEKIAPAKAVNETYATLAASASASLTLAVDEASEASSTKPLTTWKNKWLVKNSSNQFILEGALATEKLVALADVLEKYEKQLAGRGLYDYEDMILRSITALETNDDFRFTLQEKYQYLLLDEYQDSNAAQAKLVQLITDNPVNEGRPNVMAVGDDDQAIYAFQGAASSNLADFHNHYRDTKVINLTENYRSQANILLAAENVASQIVDRASQQFSNVSKTLAAASQPLETTIVRQEFLSDIAERDWVASQIEKLIIKQNVRPSQIAVLAPRHKLLEPLVPFLNQLDIPVRYEKRENILEEPIIKQLISMSRLAQALAANNESLAASLWPEVLSYHFWQLDIVDIWKISWQPENNWTHKLLKAPKFKWLALFFMQLAASSNLETLETILDYLVGSQQLKISDKKIKSATSPLKSYYVSVEIEQSRPDIFYQTISQLTVLRQKIRDRQVAQDKPLMLADLLALVDLYESAGERMTNTSPYNQAGESVQLMTVFKAKGLEFEHVFLLGASDDIWGASARGNSNKITLPANLAPLRRAGASDDERLRILFVAITRAKVGLYLTSTISNYSGKATTRLKYLDEREQDDGGIKTLILPEKYQLVRSSSAEVPSLARLETNWQVRHMGALNETNLKVLLAERLENYQLSPTHLNTFIDLERGGPRAFLLNTLLKFPQAPSGAGQYGNAIHETLEWLQQQINKSKNPSASSTIEYFATKMRAKKLAEKETELRLEQGKNELAAYLKNANFKPGDQPEHSFKNEGVFVGDAHLSGKIDKLELDNKNKTLKIVDYKTGSPSAKWQSNLKFHKYKQQLHIYKILIEGSPSYRGWHVDSMRLDFIQPSDNSQNCQLELKFDEKEFDETKLLIEAVWRHVKQLDLPDISRYSKDYAGSKQFEKDLLEDK